MNVLVALQYYAPHRTGYTLHVQRVAEALVERGHSVRVLTARHLQGLAPRESIAGVDVVRLTAPLRVSRGAVMPSYPVHAWRGAAWADVVWINTPLLETVPWGLIARWRERRLVITHHGDLTLPSTPFNRFVETFTLLNHRFAARHASTLIGYSDDYARTSAYLHPYASRLRIVHPPIAVPQPDPHASAALRARLAHEGGPLIGFAGRFAQEKRPDLLLRAALSLLDRYPSLRLVFAGQQRLDYEDTWSRCQALLREAAGITTFMGLIEDPQALADFYAACDVLALPSDTECFALVQVEAMLCGTPVVASDIPGGRVPVMLTGMGRLFEKGSAVALADALADVLAHRGRYVVPREKIAMHFDLARTIDSYEAILAGT